MTEGQIKVLKFFRSYHGRHALPPAIRDVMTHLGCTSPNAAWRHIAPLLKSGELVRLKGIPEGVSRGIAAVEFSNGCRPAKSTKGGSRQC